MVSVATVGRCWGVEPEPGSAACPEERVERLWSVLSTCEALYVSMVMCCDGVVGYLVGRRRTLLVRDVQVGWMVRDDAVCVFVCV